MYRLLKKTIFSLSFLEYGKVEINNTNINRNIKSPLDSEEEIAVSTSPGWNKPVFAALESWAHPPTTTSPALPSSETAISSNSNPIPPTLETAIY